MKKITLIIFSIVVVSFLVAGYYYNLLPDRLASHWGIDGQVNGYMGKFWGLFLMPIISLVMVLFFTLIPRIDPLKENIKKFEKEFDIFILLIVSFLFYIYVLTIIWNSGYKFNMGSLISPAIGILFFYAGSLIGKAKQNYFVGIRTPWTLASENVWDKTHLIGGKLFKASGIIALLGFFVPSLAFYFVLIPVIFSAIFCMVYSYIEYKKEIMIEK